MENDKKEMTMAYYNKHKRGIECIEVIRHYTTDIGNAIKYLWRAGLKHDAGKNDRDKEIEDLKKALWYLNDYHNKMVYEGAEEVSNREMERIIKEVTGHPRLHIIDGYNKDAFTAIGCLLRCGIIYKGRQHHVILWRHDIDLAEKAIQRRIKEISADPSPWGGER